MNLDQLLTEPIKKPKVLDSIILEYQGIKFYIYGVLHGLSGGTNKEYKNLVNETINKANGLKLGEKSMQKMYVGLNGELEDWIQMTKKDTLLLTLRLFTSPIAMCSLFTTLFKEYHQNNDRFNCELRRLQDIGGYPYFHLLEPNLRRLYVGFPSAQQYFVENYRRRNSNGNISPIIFSDPDWKWLTYIEKYVNIPYRSVHMIEFAVCEAKKRKIKEVSIFIGEIHNTDIAWYVNRQQLEPYLEKEIQDIKSKAQQLSNSSPSKILLKKFSYLVVIGLAGIIPILILLMLSLM